MHYGLRPLIILAATAFAGASWQSALAKSFNAVSSATKGAPLLKTVNVPAKPAKVHALDGVCFSNPAGDTQSALDACNSASQTLNLLSNKTMAFESNCAPQTAADYCTYMNGYVLHSTAIPLD